MANCKFIRYTQNKARWTPPPPFSAAPAFPAIINGNTGTYAGCSARVEDPSFPMDNVLRAGRKGNVWVVPDGAAANHTDGTSYVLEVDLGSLQTVVAVGLLGCSSASAIPNSTVIDAQAGVATIAAYTYAGYGALTSVGFGARDVGIILGTPVSSRFWRLRWTNGVSGHGFTVAGIVLATAITDIGFLYSGADEQRVRPRAVTESSDQSPVVTFVGPEYVRWAIQFNNNDATLRTTLDALYGDTQPFIFITPDNEWQECIWATEEFSREHIFAPPDRYRFLVELRQLG